MTIQQRWNRYVRAINYVIGHGFYVMCIDSKDNRGEWNGNIRAIRVRTDTGREVIIPLQQRRYGSQELMGIVCAAFGYKNLT